MNIVIQLFNKIKNGNLGGGNIENNASRQIRGEIKLIVKKNFESRIENQKLVNEGSIKMQESDDPWWLDNTDYLFDEEYKRIEALNKSLQPYLDKLLELSPQLHKECEDFIKLDYNVFKMMENSRIGDIKVDDLLITFPDSYSVLIGLLCDSYEKIMNDFNNL